MSVFLSRFFVQKTKNTVVETYESSRAIDVFGEWRHMNPDSLRGKQTKNGFLVPRPAFRKWSH